MKKTDLINAIRSNVNISKQDIGEVLDQFFDVVQSQVAQGEKVKIAGFGSFERRDRKRTQSRNPRTGEPVEVPAKSFPAFSPSKKFKEMVSEK